jgi:hypothetical protein
LIVEAEEEPQFEARVGQGDLDALGVSQPHRFVEVGEFVHVQYAPGVGVVIPRSAAFADRVPHHGHRILRADLDPYVDRAIVDGSQQAFHIGRFGGPAAADHQDRR